MIIKYRERTQIDQYKCIDRIKEKRVIKYSFQQGELKYFRVNEFEYFSIGENDIISID
jgi:hypothetical protein